MAIIKPTGSHEQETFTPESGNKSLELLAQQRIVEQHALNLVELHSGQMDPESFDQSVMYAHETDIRALGENPDSDALDSVTLMTSGALMDAPQAEKLFRSAEKEEDDVLRSVWSDSMAMRQHAESSAQERHALDELFSGTIEKSKDDQRSAKRISALAIGMLSHYPDLAAKYTGKLVDLE